MASISELRSNITGKSRVNRFQVILPTPFGVINNLLVRSTKFPGKTLSSIDVPFRGVKVKFVGEPELTDWDVTVFAEDYTTYQQFRQWIDLAGNITTNERGAPGDYKVDGVMVQQLGLQNEVIATCTLDGVWPISIGDIELSNETADTFTSFAVTFKVDNTTFSK